MSEHRPRAGFTAEELIAVLGIIVLLALGFFWTTRNVTSMARLSSCASNLKQLHHAARMYMADSGGRMPAEEGLLTAIYPYVHNDQVFLCPTAEKRERGDEEQQDDESGAEIETDYQFAYWAQADDRSQTLIVRDDGARHLGHTWLGARLDGAVNRYDNGDFETEWEMSRWMAEGGYPSGMPAELLY